MQTAIGTEPGRELVSPATIADEVKGRGAALDSWLAAYDSFHMHTAAAASASLGGAISLPVGGGNQYEQTELARAFVKSGIVENYDSALGRHAKQDARDWFRGLITTEIDRRCWSGLMDRLGAEALMDRQAKQEFRDSLRAAPPEFTEENCKATFGHLWENRRALFLRGIANTFSALDRRFRSHDGFKIGARIIIERALDTSFNAAHWHNYNRRDTFEDVEKLLYELDGKPAPGSIIDGPRSMVDSMRDLQTRDLPTVLQGDYFRVRAFRNGNLHIWFERDDLLEQVNRLLAEYYGEALGDGFNETEADDAPQYHLTPAKKFGAFNTSPEIAAKVADWACIGQGDRVLEPSGGTGELAKAARTLGGAVDCVEIQPGLAHELGKVHGFPRVVCADFLTMPAPTADSILYDVILMNPPFDHGRDCDHVRHAWQYLKPGGRLVAIMSARAEFGDDARHRALHKIVDAAESCLGCAKWHDLPAGSFAHAGTQVNTVVLTLRKPRA